MQNSAENLILLSKYVTLIHDLTEFRTVKGVNDTPTEVSLSLSMKLIKLTELIELTGLIKHIKLIEPMKLLDLIGLIGLIEPIKPM